MATKLTLRMDRELIERAKAYSKVAGKSVSQLVADYLTLLPSQGSERERRVTPIVQSLRGLLRSFDLDEAEYRRHLEDKYL
jgi:replicative DNA helicase